VADKNIDLKESDKVLDGIKPGKVGALPPEPSKTIAMVSDKPSAPLQPKDKSEDIPMTQSKPSKPPKPPKELPVDTPNVDRVDIEQIVAMCEAELSAMRPLDLKGMVREARTFIIEIPDDVIDSTTIIYSVAKYNAYRNKLVQMQVNAKRYANIRTRWYKAMFRMLKGVASGSSADKREAEAVARTVKYEQVMGDAEDAVDALNGFLDNLDRTYNQLSLIGKMFESPTGRLALQGGDAISEEQLPSSGHAKGFGRQNTT